MTFRLNGKWEGTRAKVQFTTSASMPYLIYRACLVTRTPSNTVYIQHAVAEALARDLNMDLHQILAELPEPRGPSAHLYDPNDHSMARWPVRIGPANTVEEIQ
jgi:hypothetical protein